MRPWSSDKILRFQRRDTGLIPVGRINKMKIEKLPESDGGCNFELVYLADLGNIGKETPHCKVHGAMNKVSVFKEGGGFWRCLQGKCRAGCIERIS